MFEVAYECNVRNGGIDHRRNVPIWYREIFIKVPKVNWVILVLLLICIPFSLQEWVNGTDGPQHDTSQVKNTRRTRNQGNEYIC